MADAFELVPPLVTPLTPTGDVDLASLERLVRHVVAAGASGVLVLGSTGEGGHLLPDEQDAVVATAAAASDVEVMAGVPALNTRHSVATAKRLVAAGARSLLVPPPQAFPFSQTELGDHFTAVSDAVDVPCIAYHVPVRVPTAVSAALLGELVGKGVLAGVKDSSGDLAGHRAEAIAVRDHGPVRLLTGSEVCIDAALQIGFTGAVPGLANVFTELHRALVDAAAAGDWAAARRTQERLAARLRLYEGPLGVGSFGACAIGALKHALVLLGVIETATLTVPFRPADEELTRHVAAVLHEVAQDGL